MAKTFNSLSKEEKIKFWKEIEDTLRRLLKEIDLKNPTEILNFLDHNELGLAFEYLIGELADQALPVSNRVHESLRAVGQQMGFDKAEGQDERAAWSIFLKMANK